eukprot:COSAG06_NODE_2807_length_6256_cov_8.116778_6_plen_105_part_00
MAPDPSRTSSIWSQIKQGQITVYQQSGLRPRGHIARLGVLQCQEVFWTEKYLPMARPHQLLLLLLAAAASSVAAGDVTVSVSWDEPIAQTDTAATVSQPASQPA